MLLPACACITDVQHILSVTYYTVLCNVFQQQSKQTQTTQHIEKRAVSYSAMICSYRSKYTQCYCSDRVCSYSSDSAGCAYVYSYATPIHQCFTATDVYVLLVLMRCQQPILMLLVVTTNNSAVEGVELCKLDVECLT
jgi:hypothetical protein